MCCFIFQSYCAPQDLHSFPTRRSSDLASMQMGFVSHYDGTAWSPVQVLTSPIASSEPLPRVRSEEHTSELQSQSNLVCRLLLEKKKHGEAVEGRLRHASSRPHHTRAGG